MTRWRNILSWKVVSDTPKVGDTVRIIDSTCDPISKTRALIGQTGIIKFMVGHEHYGHYFEVLVEGQSHTWAYYLQDLEVVDEVA